jgi:DNA recombination-dependent growth factor C
MTYIIDLTLVMQNIFWLQEDVQRPLSRRLIKLAVAVYSKSDAKRLLHDEIDQHVKDKKVFSGRDVTLDKVIELIDLHRINSVEKFKHRDQIRACNLAGDDEDWNARAK